MFYKGRRIDYLAEPKKFAPGFCEDRRSIYWIDGRPLKRKNNWATAIVASSRVLELSNPRWPVNKWKANRSSPIWEVSSAALAVNASERLKTLSQPKLVHMAHGLARSLPINVRKAAHESRTSDRVCWLAAPKQRKDQFEVKWREWGDHFPVSRPALSTIITDRVEQLSQPKRCPSVGLHFTLHVMLDFRGEKPVQWPVSKSALNTPATARLIRLSRPRSRCLFSDIFDPYRVSASACSASPTPRIEQLATPIARKRRAKKNV